MPRVVTQEDWIARAVAKHGERYDYSKAVYRSANAKVEIVCREHGSFWQDASSHTAGHGCPGCKAVLVGKAKRGDFLEMVGRASILHGNKYLYPEQAYQNHDVKIKIVCPEHGVFEQTMHGHLSGKGCDLCGGKVKLDLSEVLSRFKAAHGDKYDYSKVEYDQANRRVEIVCSEHGSFWQIPNDHWAGRGCHKCWAGGPSSGEEEIVAWLLSVKPDLSIMQSSRKVIPPREIDIWLPDYNFGIEYHGLYWHTEDRVGDMHAEKAALAEAEGIRLIQVYEDEWRDRQHAVKQIILNAIGAVEQKVMARKCLVVEVSPTDARTFLNANHVQGGGPVRLGLGLEYDGALVAVMTFNQALSGRGGYDAETWELARYATSCSVSGGAGRLLAEFDKRQPGVRLVSYVDHRYFTGAIYPKLGFTFVRRQVDYEYLFRGRRMHKSGLKKANLTKLLGDRYDNALTEREMALMIGAQRLRNAGRSTYIRAPQ